MNNPTFTVLYDSFNLYDSEERSVVISSLKLKQRQNSDSDVEIVCRNNVVKPEFFDIKSSNTSHQFIIHPVKNASFRDMVNSVSLAIIKSGIKKMMLSSVYQDLCMNQDLRSVAIRSTIDIYLSLCPSAQYIHDIPVAYQTPNTIIVYHPLSDTVKYFYCENFAKNELAELKEKCIEIYCRMLCMDN